MWERQSRRPRAKQPATAMTNARAAEGDHSPRTCAIRAWSSAWGIRVGGVARHERGDVGRVEQAGGARLQVLKVSEVADIALRCHGDQQLGRLVGGGVAEPV